MHILQQLGALEMLKQKRTCCLSMGLLAEELQQGDICSAMCPEVATVTI